MTDRVLHSRKLAAFRELEDADRSMQRAIGKFEALGLTLTSANVERVRARLKREAALARGAAGLDDQLRRIG